MNSRRPSPRVYSNGDFAFAKRSVKSVRKCGLVGKLMNSYTAPWEIIEKAAGSSYNLRHRDTGKLGKHHAPRLSPFPRELLPFPPIDGADNQYGQLHVPIQADPYKAAGVKGFQSPQPFHFAQILTTMPAASENIHFPTLAELNAELFDWHPGEEDALAADESLCIELDVFTVDTFTTLPPTPAPAPASPLVPDILWRWTDEVRFAWPSNHRTFAHSALGLTANHGG